MKRLTTTFVLTAILIFAPYAINLNTNGIIRIESSTAEAGPLSKRLEKRHSPSPHSQTAMQGGDSEAREQCIEMLHRGDHQGAQNCIEQLQSGDSTETQIPAAQTQPTSQPSAAPSGSTVSNAASGAQDELFDAREKCAEMLRSGNRAGARECIQKLRN